MTEWNEQDHPRAGGGTFKVKEPRQPELVLGAPGLPVQFVRTPSGVRRVRAASAEAAATAHIEATGEKAVPVFLEGRLADIEIGRYRVQYTFDNEGEHGEYDPTDASDTPLARVRITVDADSHDEEQYSWCTRVPAYANTRKFSDRAQEIASALSNAERSGADANQLAVDYAGLLADQPDPAIAPPATRAEAEQIFRDRAEDGAIVGWYVVNKRTTDISAGPFATRRTAGFHLPSGYDSYAIESRAIAVDGEAHFLITLES